MKLKRKGLICSMMVVFLVLAVTVLLLPAADKTGEKEEKQVTKADVEKIGKMVEAELKSAIEERPSDSLETKYWLEKTFKAKKKSSDPKLVVRRVTESLSSQAMGWVDEVLKLHTLTGEYEFKIISRKSGISGLKFYLRIIILVRLECIKFPLQAGAPIVPSKK